MKIDPYKCKEKYLRWKKETQDGIPRLSKVNSDLIHQFLYKVVVRGAEELLAIELNPTPQT